MKIWGYDQSSGETRMYFQDDWVSEITPQGAIRYLTEHLKQSLINDFETAYNAYLKKGTGYFGSLRLIFPIITFLGALYKGSDNSGNAVAFIQKYMGQVNDEYRNVGDILYAVYRHGLTHTNMPKIITVDYHDVGWVITLENEPHMTLSKQGPKEYNMWISPNQLYKDLIKAIDIYIKDFTNSEDDLLFINFKRGYIEMAKYHSGTNIQRLQGYNYLSEKIKNIEKS